MGIKIKAISIILIILLSGCQSNKYYETVRSLRIEKTSKNSRVFNNKQKRVFTKLNNELKNTNHIVYLYMPDYKAMSREDRGLIYDVDNGRYFSIIFEEDTTVVEQIEYPKDSYEAFVLENYLKKKHEYLQSLYKNYTSSLGSTENVIYDINLKEKKYTQLNFYNFPFLNGKPFDGMEPLDNGLN